MSELKLYDFQREMVDNKDSFILCNWSKGLGKTYTIVNKIIKDKPKYVIVDSLGDLTSYREKLDDILHCNSFLFKDIESLSLMNNCIKIKYKDGSKTTIVTLKDINRGVIPTEFVDLIVFDGILPYDNGYKSKQVISMITTNNYDGKLQKLFPKIVIKEYGLSTIKKYNILDNDFINHMKENDLNRYYNEIDITSEPSKIKTENTKRNRYEEIMLSYRVTQENKFYIDTLIKLEEEYDKLPSSKDTVLTRQNLLKMIMQVKDKLDDNF